MSKEKVVEIIKTLNNQPNVKHFSSSKLRRLARGYGQRTEFGNVNFSTTVRNRSASLTVCVEEELRCGKELSPRQKEILDKLSQTISQLREYLNKTPLVVVERVIGNNPLFTPYCRLYVSIQRKDSLRIAYMWSEALFETKKKAEPDLNIIYVPEWPEKERQILIFPNLGTTFVLGTDYFGEAKKGFLRMAMWQAKQKGMLGLHAGSKIVRAKDASTGKLKRYGILLFGLSATGKTTHACHNHCLTAEGEEVKVVQDDVVFWRKDGSALGTERGFFIKTDGINPETQPLIYKAATCPRAIFENVMVDFEGRVNFGDFTLTGNGRGIIQMADLGKYASEGINLPTLEQLDGLIIFFITRRNTVLPIVSKLTPQQAVAAFMLGESIETSAGDPARAGESVRVVGTNPFIIGDEAEEGNRFYEFVTSHPGKIQCFLLNTGGVGELVEKEEGKKFTRQRVLRVEIPEMAAIIRGIVRGNIEWAQEPYFGTLVPKKVEGVDISKFELSRFYSADKIEEYVNQLKRERKEYLSKFPDLVINQ